MKVSAYEYFEGKFLTPIILAFDREVGPEYESEYLSPVNPLNLKLRSSQMIYKMGELLSYPNL
jgi:hypothetical protein